MKFAKPTFIVFEGLDGSGKSTCAARLASLTDATLLTTPCVRVRRFRDELLDYLGPQQESRQLFYLATVFAASESVRALLAEGTSVVLDRYFLSTQSYAAFRGSRLRVDELSSLLTPADVTIYLDAHLDARRARLERRATTAADLETLTVEADAQLRREHLQRAQRSVVGQFACVDGGGDDSDRVFARVVDALASSGVVLV
ncbi:MAG: AAA family ATPase [Polyangiales bacterium]